MYVSMFLFDFKVCIMTQITIFVQLFEILKSVHNFNDPIFEVMLLLTLFIPNISFVFKHFVVL